jgi:tripartite-type tricarboxylate transporter receptor subunit TctC
MPASAHAIHRRTLLGRLAPAGLLAATLPAWAQGSAVTRLVVPFTPGASNDVIGRMVAEAVARKSGQTWIVENKPGAGSMLGADAVAKAAPDGRTLLLCASANMGILPAIQKTMRYAVERDFTFLARIASSPFALAVNAQFPATSFADFVRLAKARPGAVRIGSAGVGSLDYMGTAMLQAQLGLALNVIPYKGMAPVLNDLRAGHIDACIVSPPTVRPMVLDGKVRVLAVLDAQRNALLPDVPSAKELGHPALMVGNWWGIAGPANMDPAVVASLRQALMQVLSDPSFLSALQEKGFDPAVLAGDAFTQFVHADLKNWKAVAVQAKVSIDE